MTVAFDTRATDPHLATTHMYDLDLSAIPSYPLDVHIGLASFNQVAMRWMSLAASRAPALLADGETESSLGAACEQLRFICSNVNLWVGERTMTACARELLGVESELRGWSAAHEGRFAVLVYLRQLRAAVARAEGSGSATS